MTGGKGQLRLVALTVHASFERGQNIEAPASQSPNELALRQILIETKRDQMDAGLLSLLCGRRRCSFLISSCFGVDIRVDVRFVRVIVRERSEHLREREVRPVRGNLLRSEPAVTVYGDGANRDTRTRNKRPPPMQRRIAGD